MEYVKTEEIHSSLDSLVESNSIFQDTIKDLEEDLQNTKRKISDLKKQIRINEKDIKKHSMITENRYKHCLECGYVESKIKD